MARSRGLQVTISGDASQLERAFRRSEAAARQFGTTTGKVHQSAKKHAEESVIANATLTGSFKQMARAAVTAGAGFAAAYVGIAKAKDAIKTTEDLAHTVENLHRNFGLTNKVASEWASVAHVNGIQSSSLHMAFTKLSSSIGKLEQGSKPAVKAFKDLGLSQKDLKGLNFQQVLQLVTTRLTEMHGGAKRAADAQALLGRGAKTLVPLMREGGLGFKEQAKWAREYGATLDGHAIKSAEELRIASEKLKFAQLGLQIQFTEKIAPALLKVEDAGAKVVKIFRDPHLTDDQKWQKLSNMLGGVASSLEHGFEKALPHIADAVGNAAPHIAATFVNGFLKAGSLGKLAIAGWLITKFGGWGAFTSLGKRAGSSVTTGLLGGVGGGRLAGRLGGMIGGLKIGGGIVAGAFIGQQIVAGILRQIPGNLPHKIADTLEHPGRDVTQTFRPSLTNPSGVPKGGPSTATQTRQFNQMSAAIRRGTIDLGKLNTMLGRPGSSGFTKNQERQLRSLATAVHQLPSGFGYLRNKAASSLQDLNKQVDINIGSIRRIMETDPARGRKAMETDFRLGMKNVKRLLDDGKDHTGTAMREIRRLMKVHSQAGAEAFASNARSAIGTLKQLMKAGVVSTRAGTKEIRSLETQALQGFGFSRKDALSITRKGGNVGPGGHPEEGTTGHAGGGYVGMPGEAGPDAVPIIVGRGEAVLNRHQQVPVEAALQTVYGMGLDDLFGQIQRPHYMARGGRVPGFAKGGFAAMVGAANAIDRKHYAYSWGGGHNDSFSGPYDCSGAVSAVLHAGGVLQHPLVSGQLAHFGKPGPGKVTIFANPTHTYMRIGGRYFGTSNSNPGGGAGWFQGSPRPGFAVRHVDAAGGTITAPKVSGPNSPLKRIVTTALSRETAGANQAITRLMSQMGQTGGGDWGDFAQSHGGQFGLGALARLWTQAGGPSKYANLMAWVAMAESHGNPKAHNPSGASGLWQILGAVRPGNLFNPIVNARNAVAKFRGAGRHPLAPWYSSQHGGAIPGGWGPHTGGLRFARGGRVGRFIGASKGKKPAKGPHATGGHRQARSPHGPRILPHVGGQITVAGFESLLNELDYLDAQRGTPDTATRTQLLQGEIYLLEQQLKIAGPKKADALRQQLTPLYQQLHDLTAPADSGDPNQPLIDALQANTDAQNANAQALADAKASIDAQVKFAETNSSLVAQEAVRFMVDQMNGQMGPRIARRVATPSYGAVST